MLRVGKKFKVVGSDTVFDCVYKSATMALVVAEGTSDEQTVSAENFDVFIEYIPPKKYFFAVAPSGRSISPWMTSPEELQSYITRFNRRDWLQFSSMLVDGQLVNELLNPPGDHEDDI